MVAFAGCTTLAKVVRRLAPNTYEVEYKGSRIRTVRASLSVFHHGTYKFGAYNEEPKQNTQ